MLSSGGVSRIKLKRNLFKVENKLEPNKRRWTGPKTMSGLNPPADRVAQDETSAPTAADEDEPFSLKRDSAEHDGQAGYDKGTLLSRVSSISDSRSESAAATTRGPRTRSEWASSPRLCEHKKQICYRLRLALCFAEKKRRNCVRRARQTQNDSQCRGLSYINSNVSVKSGNISIKSTVRAERSGENGERTLPVREVQPKYVGNTGDVDILEKPRRGPGRPRKVYIHSFGESAAQVKTTIETEVQRAQTSRASKSRCTLSGRAQNISSKVELRRCLRSGSRKDLKRLVKNSCCALCGDVKYSPPPSKNLAHLLTHRPRAGRPGPTARRKSAGHISKPLQPPTAPKFQFEKCPMVKLCDVARVFAITSRDFSCVLPEVLTRKKCKRVRCLKKEFRFLVHPHLSGVKKHRSKIDNLSWEVSTPTNSCASFSSGDPPSGATGCQCVSETAEDQDGCDSYPYGKRRQVDVHHVADSPGFCNGDTENTCPMNVLERCEGTPSLEHRVPPIILRRVPPVNGCGFRSEAESKNSALSLDEGEEDNERNDYEAELNLPESFSCQRTQAYAFFYQSSCARVCKTWPFPRSGPPDELRSLLHSGRRWIVTTSFLDTPATTCLLDVQDKLCKPTEHSVGRAETKEALEVLAVSSVSGEKLESNQSVQRAFEDSSHVPEFSASAEKKQVDNDELNHVMNSEGRSPKSQPSILTTPGRKAFSVRSENQLNISVIATEDSTLPSRCVSNSKCTQINICPVSHTPSVPVLENREELGVGALTFYNPESLSELCLKVETLQAQCPSSALTSSTAERCTQKPYFGKKKQRGDGSTVTGSSSSADENEHNSIPSSDEDPVERDDPESLLFNDHATSQTDDNDPSQSVEDSTIPNSFLDVSRAYEEDVLILDVIQDDPDLFGAVFAETINKPGTLTENEGEAQIKRQTGNYCKIVWDLDTDSSQSASDLKMENMEDSLRTVNEIQSYKAQPSQGLQVTSAFNSETAVDLNNNQENENNVQSIKVMNTRTSRFIMDTSSFGYGYTAKDSCALRTSNNYCWFYFDEHNACHRNCCRFLHIPRDGDEMFCMERILKFCFVGNPNTVLRAVEVFMQYYSKCSPSVCFSQEIVNSLLSSLLNLGLLRKFVDVINLLLTHKSLPSPEIVLAAFKHVRDRGLIDSISELSLLTSKIVEAGCVFSVDQCEVMQNHLQMMQVPRQQMDIFLAVKCRALATNPHTAELSDLAQAVVRVEMLKHQEDWSGMAHVFCGVCTGPHSTSELHRFYCCVTMALLKEPNDKLTLPYELFTESVCQQVPSDDMVKIVLGRIGVSLIFRYHRTREWNKGVKLVNVMFGLQIEFTTLKGLMGNEYKVSRCQLVTSATELFLHSGSIEGALKMLRADNWFVTSNVWPCDPADIDCRKRVLTLLAGRTSHRDTFDILTNLPGLRQPINGVQVDEYTEMFNAHLRLCMMKQTLPVAADILEFMLAQGMVPETPQLQNLIHKLGKQNNWSRARALFNRARSAGYYSAVGCERDSLFLPCSLTEIEMTLTFEMFITSLKTYLQAPAESSQPLIITLRRQGEVENVSESMYLAAGCRLLSAALIPNPKLNIRYTAVNQSQEQLFILDRGSAHKWLSQNEQWALEMWRP